MYDIESGNRIRMLEFATYRPRVFHSVPAGTLLKFYTLQPRKLTPSCTRMFLSWPLSRLEFLCLAPESLAAACFVGDAVVILYRYKSLIPLSVPAGTLRHMFRTFREKCSRGNTLPTLNR